MPPPPAELIDHIFSFLRKDTLSLKACSKAHPLLSRLAERHLYAHIVVNPRAPEICNHLLKNSRYLVYPRTLEIRSYLRSPLAMSIISIIPQMANLVSFRICDPLPFSRNEIFLSTLRNCLQQSSFQKLYLFYIHNLRFSVLDDAKNVKQLTLDDCTADEDEPISSSPSQVSLETLVLSGELNRGLHLWATRWVTRLTTLKLIVRDTSLDRDWTEFPGLLAACANSLTSFHLDMSDSCTQFEWEHLPFTLSALKRLKRLSISALIIGNLWALPEIIWIVNTAPAIQDVNLRFHSDSDSIESLARLDWSLFDNLQSNLTGKRPRIDLSVTCMTSDNTISSQSVHDLPAANEALMDLVKRGQITLR